MEKKTKTKVATNVSSGAEKVEKVEKTVKKTQSAGRRSVPMQEKEEKIDVKQMNAHSSDGRAEQESAAAKARVQAAIEKQEAKLHRKEEKEKVRKKKEAERKAAAEKRAAEHRERAEKRAAERKARMEKQQAEMDAYLRERAHAKANRNQERVKAKKEREHHNRSRHSYGGWLAAVVVLGATTLGLTTAVTVGAIEMSDMNNGMTANYQATTYELVGVAEHVDDDLDRVRLAASSEQQGRILTDLLVQARLAEADLERLPICAESSCNLTKFFNQVAKESEHMLGKLRRGEALTERDEEMLQHLYERAHGIKAELGKYVSSMTDADLRDFIKKGEGGMQSLFTRLEEMTLPENSPMPGIMPKMDGAGKERMPIPSEEGGSPAITPAQAEEMCKTYFSEYKINEFQCTGETVARGFTAYNVQGYDDNGTMLFAELDYKNGELIRFDYFEPCEGENFDMDNAQTLADNFLAKLGYDSLTATRARENGTDVDFTYVYEQDGVVYYPDTVHIKVCRSRGVVTGFDCSKYLKNHTNRTAVKTAISQETAQGKLHKDIQVENARLAVVNTARGERAAYEFVCSYKGERYLIYTDANSGEELSIINLNALG